MKPPNIFHVFYYYFLPYFKIKDDLPHFQSNPPLFQNPTPPPYPSIHPAIPRNIKDQNEPKFLENKGAYNRKQKVAYERTARFTTYATFGFSTKIKGLLSVRLKCLLFLEVIDNRLTDIL